MYDLTSLSEQSESLEREGRAQSKGKLEHVCMNVGQGTETEGGGGGGPQ